MQEIYIQHGWKLLNDRINHLKETDYIDVFNENDFNLVIENYGERIEKFIPKKFESHLFIDEWIEEIKYIVIQSLLKELSHKLTGKFQDHFKEEINLEQVEYEITDELLEVYRRFNRGMIDYKRKKFINPIVDIVETLPIEELADTAEALLNITSLKRKMSRSLETVGGPIDVALITKGDGFTWIKRK